MAICAPSSLFGQDAASAAEIKLLEGLLPTASDSAALLYALAADYAQTGQQQKALAALRRVISANEGFNPAHDRAFKTLYETAEFQSIVATANLANEPVHRATVAFTLPENDLIPEGLENDPATDTFYISSLFRKKIVRFSSSEPARTFAQLRGRDALPLCGLRLDADHSLWANGCSEKGNGRLYHFNRTGRLRQQFSPPASGKHLLNDLVIRTVDGAPGEIYLTDSLANAVYLVDPAKGTFTPIAFPRQLFYPNGITLSADHNFLFVADGLGVMRYDLRSQKAQEIHAGPHNTLAGFDGLYWYHGDLVGVQNGIGVPRLVEVRLSPNGLRVQQIKILEYRSALLSSPTTGAIVGSHFYFIANSQLDNLSNGRIMDPARLEPVRIGVVALQTAREDTEGR
jgi:hypothetical protein